MDFVRPASGTVTRAIGIVQIPNRTAQESRGSVQPAGVGSHEQNCSSQPTGRPAKNSGTVHESHKLYCQPAKGHASQAKWYCPASEVVLSSQ